MVGVPCRARMSQQAKALSNPKNRTEVAKLRYKKEKAGASKFTLEAAEDAMAGGQNKVILSAAMIVQIVDLYNRGVFMNMVESNQSERDEKVMYHRIAADFLDPKMQNRMAFRFDSAPSSPVASSPPSPPPPPAPAARVSSSESETSTSGRKCAGTGKNGPCGSAPLKGKDYCRHHGPK